MGNRRRVRGSNAFTQIYSADGPGGPHFLRRSSVDQAERLVKDGKAIRVCAPESNETLGYQLKPQGAPVGHRGFRPGGDSQVGSQPSTCCLSRGEVEAAVGLMGESITAGMKPHERAAMAALKQPEYDFIECARVKLDAFDPRNGRKDLIRVA